METVKCNLCGSKDYKAIHLIDVTDKNLKYYLYSRNIPNNEVMTGEFTIVKCLNCSLMYTNPRLTEDELQLLYSSNSHLGGNWRDFPYLFDLSQPDDLQSVNTHEPEIRIRSAAWQVGLIDSYLEKLHKERNQVQILDVGCGLGGFMKAAENAGYRVWGCDISPDRINYARDVYKLKHAHLGQAHEVFSGKTFDIITLWDVVEHLTDPVGLLKKLRNLLHPEGLIVILTMSTDSVTYKLMKKSWYYIDPVGHLYYFSHTTMKNLFKISGFRYLEWKYDSTAHTPKKILIHTIVSGLTRGLLNLFFFQVYSNPLLYRIIGRYVSIAANNKIPHKRMLKRLENLTPYLLSVTYKECFVYVATIRENP